MLRFCRRAFVCRERSRSQMAKRSSLWLLLTAASGLGTGLAIADASRAYRPDQILVQPKPGVSLDMIARFHARQKSRLLQSMVCSAGLQILRVPTGETVASLVAKYQQSGLVEFAEPDYLRHTALTTPNDPKYLDGTLWALNNYGQDGGTAHADISAPEAWDILTSASNIIVAVIDTGVRYTHEDLSANMWVNPVDGGHGTNSFAGTNDPNDDEGHGTLMAGVIGGVGNNGKGVTGVAWQVQIMACKCFDSAGVSSDSAIIAAIDYARLNGARIINASFDSPNFGAGFSNSVYRASLAGILFVASCGNDSTNVDVWPRYPACLGISNIVSVAYTTRNDTLGQFSNYGTTNVDLAAPGANIYSCFFASDTAYLGGPLEGTSFAAAYVSGALALILTKFPSEPYAQTIVRLLNAADPIPALAGTCVTGGRLNLRNALDPPIRLRTIPPLIPGLVQLEVISAPARLCVVQSSTDLAIWSPVLTNGTSPNGTFEFSELIPTNSLQRFYRAVALP
jgi:subtilisin family serine protease